jgi:hypothetical protein
VEGWHDDEGWTPNPSQIGVNGNSAPPDRCAQAE